MNRENGTRFHSMRVRFYSVLNQARGHPRGREEHRAGAFNTCDSLSEVVLPDSLETVADTAFNWDLNLDFVEFGTNIRQLWQPEQRYRAHRRSRAMRLRT